MGVGIVIVVSMLLCAFGAELVRKSSAYMMFVVVGVLLLIMALVIAAGDATSRALWRTRPRTSART